MKGREQHNITGAQLVSLSVLWRGSPVEMPPRPAPGTREHLATLDPAARLNHSDDEPEPEPTGGLASSPDEAPIYEARFEVPRFNKIRSRVFKLYPDRICICRTEQDSRPEQTIDLNRITDATLHRLEH